MSIEARFRLRRHGFSLDFDMELPGTGVSALYGPSGAGKTTLLRAFAGLERLPGGYLVVNGECWQDEDHFVPTHRRSLGYVFQEASLFGHLDVRRNLEFGIRRIPTEQRRVSLEAAVELLGIGNLLEREVATLSGGERQRVAIARALATSPRLLLLDEPLASLDAERKRDILPWLESLHTELEIPLILVSHDPNEVARLADHLVLLENGQATASGPVRDVLTRLELPLAADEDAAAILDAVVTGYDEEYALTRLEAHGHLIQVAHPHLERGRKVRLRVHARDVSVTLSTARDTSILNVLPARVDEVTRQGPSQAMVRLLLEGGDTPLLARVTRRSVAGLGLEPGTAVFAQVKSVALLD